MALGFVQGTFLNAGSGSATTIVKAFASNVTSGNLLVAFCFNATGVGGFPTITDSQGNTWSTTVHNTIGTTVLSQSAAIAGSSGADTVTATWSLAQSFPELWIGEFNIGGHALATDGTVATSSDAGTTLNTASITTTNNPAIVIAHYSNNGSLSGLSSGWAENVSDTSNGGFSSRVVTTPASYSLSATQPAGGDQNAIYAFKATAAANLRPFSGGNLGNINVTGTVTPRFNPVRPRASGPINVTGSVTPRLPGSVVAIVQHQPSFGLSASYNNAQTAGNANIVFFSVSTSVTISVSDSVNGAYTQLGSTQLGGVTWGIWYKFSIAAAAAGANTVTVSDGGFNGDLEILEVSGLLGTTDGYLGAGGFSTAVATGNLSTTNADDVLLGFYGTGNTFSAFGAAPWIGIDGTGTQGSEWQETSATGSFNATFTTTGTNNWGAAIGAFPAKAGTNLPFRPGPLSGSIVVTGSAALRPILRPGATGTLGLSGRVNSPLRPNASGTLGVSGAAHGRLNTPNQINVTGSTKVEYTFRPFPLAGTLGLVSARLAIRLVGTDRPLASGTLGLTGTVLVRTSPFRPNASGSILVTGTVFPRYGFIRPPILGTISLTAVLAPRFIFRPMATGIIRTSGGSTFARLTLRPGASGTISVTSTLLVPRYLATPGARGIWGLIALVTPHQGGVTRPFASGPVTVSGLVIPLFNPFRPFPSQFSTLTLNFSGVINPEFFFPGRVTPPVFGSGWNVVAGVWGAYYTVLMVPGVNYNEIYSGVITPVPSQQAGIAYQIANGLY